MKQTKNELAIMKMSAESTSSMMLDYPNGTTLSNGRVKDKSYQVYFFTVTKQEILLQANLPDALKIQESKNE